MTTSAPPVELRRPLVLGGRPRSSGALPVFFAVLAPMSTVPAIRRLLVEGHGGSSSLAHGFVAAGMLGTLLGAPLIAARADRRGNHQTSSATLFALDALVLLATSLPIPTALLLLLRPLHGAFSVGALSLLFARFRGSQSQLVSRAGAAAVAALAVGPALGGALTRFGPSAPFRFAAALSLVLALTLAPRARAAQPALPRRAREPERMTALLHTLWAPLMLVASQRFVIGGLVAAFAIHARDVHNLSDAQVGMCFSTLLVLFAGGVWWLGRRPAADWSRWILPGAALFAVSIGYLAVAPARWLAPTLAAAGLGAACVYAPCLALVAGRAHSRATALALLHVAGGLGMLLGPLGALGIGLLLRSSPAQAQTGAFFALTGLAHLACALCLLPALRRLASASSGPAAATGSTSIARFCESQGAVAHCDRRATHRGGREPWKSE